MEPKLSKYFAGFRRNHNTQHAILRMIESFRTLLNKGQEVGVIVMDLSKAFHTLNHKLLLKNYKLMVLIKNHSLLLKAILLRENKELK